MSKNEKPTIESAWNIWLDCIKGDDQNTIFRQINNVLWDATIYRLVLESRRAILEDFPDNPPLNPYFQALINRCFFHSQAVSIRRLVDTSSGLTGKKGVFSLLALVNDIASYRTALTREKYMQLRQMPYDYLPIIKLERDYIREHTQKNKNRAFAIPQELIWERIDEAHVSFDRLCRKTPTTRNPQDIIREEVFVHIKEKLETCDEIRKYVDKYIAHSATPESRAEYNFNKTEITFNHLWEAHKTIYEVAEFLSTFLFSESCIPLPWIEPEILFHNWMISFQGKLDINKLKEKLDVYRNETDQWRLKGVEELWR